MLANDTDPIPNDTLTVSAVDGQASHVGHAIAGAYGTLKLNADGSYTYRATDHHKVLPSDGVSLNTFTYMPKTWLADREQRACIIGEWLQTEARFLA